MCTNHTRCATLELAAPASLESDGTAAVVSEGTPPDAVVPDTLAVDPTPSDVSTAVSDPEPVITEPALAERVLAEPPVSEPAFAEPPVPEPVELSPPVDPSTLGTGLIKSVMIGRYAYNHPWAFWYVLLSSLAFVWPPYDD